MRRSWAHDPTLPSLPGIELWVEEGVSVLVLNARTGRGELIPKQADEEQMAKEIEFASIELLGDVGE